MSLLNSDQIYAATGAFERHFQLFSSDKNSYCTIIKEPIKVINTDINSENILPGYSNDEFNQTSITYQPVSGVYPCISLWGNQINQKQFTELKFNLGINDVQIKVKSDCRDFITQGKNELVYLKNVPFSVDENYKIQDFLGSLYYYFKLTATQ